jgi:hypothetical protein
MIDDLGPDIAARLIQEGKDPDAPDGETTGGPSITNENVRTALDLVSQANALVFSMAAPHLLKHPLKRDAQTGRPLPLVIDKDVALAAFKLTDAQHDELDPRAARLAQRYAARMPEWLKKNFDAYVLAVMFLRFQAENAKTAITAQITRDVAAFRATQAQPSPPADSDRQPVNGRERTHTDVHTSESAQEPPEGESLEPDGGIV